MKRISLTLAALAFLASPAFATPVTADKVTACEKEWKASQKAAKAAAPVGYVPAPVKGARAAALAACVSK